MATIMIDEHAYRLLTEKKKQLKDKGMKKATFSDAVRYACGVMNMNGGGAWD